MSKRYQSLEQFLAAVDRLPLVKRYLSSSPIVKADERRPGGTFTTSGVRWEESEINDAENQLLRVATRAWVGKSRKGGPSTVALFNAPPAIVQLAVRQLVQQNWRPAEKETQKADDYQERLVREAEALRDRRQEVEALLSDFPDLGLWIDASPEQASTLHTVRDNEGGVVFFLNPHPATVTGGWGEPLSTKVLRPILEEYRRSQTVREVFQKEVFILDQAICKIKGDQCYSDHDVIFTIGPEGYWRASHGGKSRSAEIGAAYKLGLFLNGARRVFSWTEDDLSVFFQEAGQLLASLQKKREDAWALWRRLAKPGRALNTADNELTGEGHYRYVIREAVIDGTPVHFTSHQEAQTAVREALAGGCYFAWHHALGENLRDRAKKEGWKKWQCQFVTLLRSGARLRQETYRGSFYGQGGDKWQAPRTHYYTGRVWYIGDLLIPGDYQNPDGLSWAKRVQEEFSRCPF